MRGLWEPTDSDLLLLPLELRDLPVLKLIWIWEVMDSSRILSLSDLPPWISVLLDAYPMVVSQVLVMELRTQASTC